MDSSHTDRNQLFIRMSKTLSCYRMPTIERTMKLILFDSLKTSSKLKRGKHIFGLFGFRRQCVFVEVDEAWDRRGRSA